jgi:ABC-type tungstate transport system permease subunit
VEEYKKSLNPIATKEEERARWEAAKKQEAQRLIGYFSAGEGKAQVLKLNKEDGR